MKAFYWLRMFLRFPKKDMARSGGCVGDQGVTVTHIYSTEARIKSR
jgi:hypothetical protein